MPRGVCGRSPHTATRFQATAGIHYTYGSLMLLVVVTRGRAAPNHHGHHMGQREIHLGLHHHGASSHIEAEGRESSHTYPSTIQYTPRVGNPLRNHYARTLGSLVDPDTKGRLRVPPVNPKRGPEVHIWAYLVSPLKVAAFAMMQACKLPNWDSQSQSQTCFAYEQVTLVWGFL